MIGYVLPSPSAAVISASPNAGWTYPGANAIRYNDVVYLAWVDSSGNAEVAAYNDWTSAQIGSTFTLKASLGTDWHDVPAVAILESGKVIAAYCHHSGAAMYVRISTSAEDVSAWGTEVDIDSQIGGSGYTYPTLIVDAAGTVHLFYRTDGAGGNGEPSTWCEATSDDDGATWSAQTAITAIPTVLSYLAMDYDPVTGRYDFAITEGSADADNADLYHFYRVDGAYFKSDGTAAGASSSLTVANMTKAHEGGTAGARYPWAIRCNRGNPVITWPEHTAGAKDWHYARWDGAAWDDTNVVSDGATGEAWVEGGFSPEHDNPYVGWLCRATGGVYSAYKYRSRDLGATWVGTIVATSPSDDFYPVAVKDARRIRAVVLRGTASSFTSYTLAGVAVSAW